MSSHHHMQSVQLSIEQQCEKLRKESEELCFLKRLRPAHEKAVSALKQATDLYGKTSLRLVPYYLVMVDISLQERALKSAEEVLSQINWLLVKDQKLAGGAVTAVSTGVNGAAGAVASTAATHGSAIRQDIPDELKNLYVIRMNKLYSVLLMEYEAYPEALQRAAHGTYHCSLLFGPEHLYTSELYFCLGLIFARMGQHQELQPNQAPVRENENALGMFDKVVDIWYRFLTNPPEETAAWMLEHQRLRIHEASHMLQHIITLRHKALGNNHIATGEVLYTQGLLFLFLGDHAQAKAFVRQALDVYIESLGAEHPSTQDVNNVLLQLQEAGV